MQWLLNAVLAVECLSMPFFAAGAVAGRVWYGGRRMGATGAGWREAPLPPQVYFWRCGGGCGSGAVFSAGVIRRPFWMNSWGCMRR